jgi:hypothetical protein
MHCAACLTVVCEWRQQKQLCLRLVSPVAVGFNGVSAKSVPAKIGWLSDLIDLDLDRNLMTGHVRALTIRTVVIPQVYCDRSTWLIPCVVGLLMVFDNGILRVMDLAFRLEMKPVET